MLPPNNHGDLGPESSSVLAMRMLDECLRLVDGCVRTPQGWQSRLEDPACSRSRAYHSVTWMSRTGRRIIQSPEPLSYRTTYPSQRQLAEPPRQARPDCGDEAAVRADRIISRFCCRSSSPGEMPLVELLKTRQKEPSLESIIRRLVLLFSSCPSLSSSP